MKRDKTLSLCRSQRINFLRPSADLLFESVADVWKRRSIGVILSGLGKDGALGSRAIKNAGGRVLALDRSSCASFGMPLAAIETGAVDFVLPLPDLASALITLVTVPGAAQLFRVSPAFSLSHAYRHRLQHTAGSALSGVVSDL